eukprot:scaffold5932_cov68-Cylindrotheca_fusiformis.AAC.3
MAYSNSNSSSSSSISSSSSSTDDYEEDMKSTKRRRRRRTKRPRNKRRHCTFIEKLRMVAVCLLVLAIINFTLLHLLQNHILEKDDEHQQQQQQHDLLTVTTTTMDEEEKEVDPTEYSSNKSIMPKKIITVIGKESSGTTFVSKTIAQALQLPGKNEEKKYRDGYYHHARRRYDENPIQVQHVSLPQGAWCIPGHDHHIVDVILPAQCVEEKVRRRRRRRGKVVEGTTTKTTTTQEVVVFP